MKIVVDTNIVFSAILNIDSQIARILLYSGKQFEFFSCDFLKMEIAIHANKILKITKYSEEEFHEIEYLVTKKIHFMNHLLIDSITIKSAEKMLKNIDLDDAPFLALSKHIKAPIWTGDKKLYNGLLQNGYKQICNTQQLLSLLKL